MFLSWISFISIMEKMSRIAIGFLVLGPCHCFDNVDWGFNDFGLGSVPIRYMITEIISSGC